MEETQQPTKEATTGERQPIQSAASPFSTLATQPGAPPTLAADPSKSSNKTDFRLTLGSKSQANNGELSIISQPILIEANSTSSTVAASANGATSALQMELGSQSVNQRASGGQWMLVAAQTTNGMRQRMSLASDQLSHSLRQLYNSASSITDVPPSYQNIPGIVPYYHGRSSGPPPSYDDVINPYAPPPTYQSLFGQMREARKSSRGLVDLLRRLLIILISTLGCTILIAFMILIPFTMIIVGAVYIDECRVEHIPAFLLVGGLVWASKNIIHCYAQCQPQQQQQQPEPPQLPSAGQSGEQQTQPATSGGSFQTESRQHYQQRHHQLKSSICESLLNCVLFGWFIAGCVIVFRNYEPDFENVASARYCHRTVYMYTFWLITSAIIVFSLFIGCICCLMVSSAIASRQEEDLG